MTSLQIGNDFTRGVRGTIVADDEFNGKVHFLLKNACNSLFDV